MPPPDNGIIEEVQKITDDSMVPRMDYEEGIAKGLIKVMGDEMDQAYLNALLAERYDEAIIREHGPKIVYTPLHGVGGTLAPDAFKMWGFQDVLTEPEQMKPDGDFPTAASPNPEEGAALDRAIKLGEKEGSDLVLATDPDADRLGIAVKHDGKFRLMTGNQVSALVADFILTNRKGSLDRQPGIVTTVVTSPMVKKVADSHGAACPLVLTGFKWIAEQIRAWEAKAPDSPQFIYGTEESYGYLIGDHCRDKDGIVAACVVAEMAAHAKANGKTIVDLLDDLYIQHGVHFEWQKSVTLPGFEGSKKIQAILDAVRNNPPAKVGDQQVVKFQRLDTGEIFVNGKPAEKSELPASDVFMFDLANGSRAILRPSGTEPKIKFYFFLCASEKPGSKDEVQTIYKSLEQSAPEFQKTFFNSIGYDG